MPLERQPGLQVPDVSAVAPAQYWSAAQSVSKAQPAATAPPTDGLPAGSGSEAFPPEPIVWLPPMSSFLGGSASVLSSPQALKKQRANSAVMIRVRQFREGSIVILFVANMRKESIINSILLGRAVFLTLSYFRVRLRFRLRLSV